MVKDIIVIYRKSDTILILISLERYFSHPEHSILNLFSLTLRRHCKIWRSGPLWNAKSYNSCIFVQKICNWNCLRQFRGIRPRMYIRGSSLITWRWCYRNHANPLPRVIAAPQTVSTSHNKHYYKCSLGVFNKILKDYKVSQISPKCPGTPQGTSWSLLLK